VHHLRMTTSNRAGLRAEVPAVAAVERDTLVELVYDADKKETALAVSRFGGLWNVEKEVCLHTGETLVPYSPRNNLIVHGCVLLPSSPQPYGDKATLVQEIKEFLHRYVDLSPSFEKIAAYYVLLSWVHDAFNEVPYLRLRGDYGTGKTRALQVIGSLCYRPIFASGASTVSPLFHTIDRFGGTLILDEADFRLSDATSEIVKILNNGHMKGLPVLRTMQNRDKEFNPQAFHVYGPKLVAMRGEFDDPALASRFITENTSLREMRVDIPITLPPAFHQEALALRNRLLHFRFCEFFNIKPGLGPLLEGVEPRVNQIALPLLSLVDDPALRAEIGRRLSGEQADRRLARQNTLEARVLAILNDASLAPGSMPISIGTITDRFKATHGLDYSHPISHKLIGHVVRKGLHLSTEKYDGVYVVPETEKKHIQVLSARYFGPN
jgi:hypothetical protein